MNEQQRARLKRLRDIIEGEPKEELATKYAAVDLEIASLEVLERESNAEREEKAPKLDRKRKISTTKTRTKA